MSVLKALKMTEGKRLQLGGRLCKVQGQLMVDAMRANACMAEIKQKLK